MSVNVYNLKDGALRGEKNGYSYQLIQAAERSTYYQMTDPTGQNKMIEITSERDADALIGDPEAFWKLYCAK